MEGWSSNNEVCVKNGHYWISTTADAFLKLIVPVVVM
jgi:hypothetical protein